MLYTGIVRLHKRAVATLIKNSGVELTVRLAVARVTSGVNPLYGDLSRETAKTGDVKGPWRCLWYDAVTRGQLYGSASVVDKLAGQYREADYFAELWLADVLVDQNDPTGLTWFDRCQAVISSGKLYRFLGLIRYSLGNTTPYGVVVALKGGAGLTD